jgi:hypothetical protein
LIDHSVKDGKIHMHAILKPMIKRISSILTHNRGKNLFSKNYVG